jgi:transcriptional regulator with XRE-family HTH domain
MRQRDVADAADVAQSTVSLIERGHIENVSLPALRAVFAAVDASFVCDVRWRGGALDRLLDERHSDLVAAVVTALKSWGWEVAVEATYSRYGERGSVDILAAHAARRVGLVIEVKTELNSIEETLRLHDVKVRLGPALCFDRFGWRPAMVGRLLVVLESTTARRRFHAKAAVFDTALPQRGQAIRRWLRSPDGQLNGLWFLPVNDDTNRKRGSGGPDRVRGPRRLRP